jgi:PII-like signaling protein
MNRERHEKKFEEESEKLPEVKEIIKEEKKINLENLTLGEMSDITSGSFKLFKLSGER